MRGRSLAAALLAALSASACSGSDATEAPAGGTLAASLKRVEPGAGARLRPPVRPNADGDLLWTSAVTIHSFRSPIFEISLAADDRLQAIYTCPAGDHPDDCMVELAGAALDDVLLRGQLVRDAGPDDPDAGPDAAPVVGGPAVVPAGSYPMVYFSQTCGRAPVHTEVSAEAVIAGTTYYTDPDAPGLVSTTGPARTVVLTYDQTERPSDCNNYGYVLPSPLEIVDGVERTFTMYFDLVSMGFIASGDPETLMEQGGCSAVRDSVTPFICVGTPEIAGTLSEAPPVVEHYRLNREATLAGFFDAEDQYFGGYLRPTFFPGERPSEPPLTKHTQIATFIENDDGTYTLEGKKAAPGDFNTDAFERTAVGEVRTGSYTGVDGANPRPYEATRLD